MAPLNSPSRLMFANAAAQLGSTTVICIAIASAALATDPAMDPEIRAEH